MNTVSDGKEMIRQIATAKFIEKLNLIFPVSDALSEMIFSYGKFRIFANRKYISSPLERNARIFFILSGSAHIFIREEDTDITIRLISQNTIVLHEAMSYRPGYLQSIGLVEVFHLPVAKLEDLVKRDLSTKEILRVLKVLELQQMELSSFINKLKPLQSRLMYFRLSHPPHEDSVPLKYISSYLGMNLETLIRLRKI